MNTICFAPDLTRRPAAVLQIASATPKLALQDTPRYPNSTLVCADPLEANLLNFLNLSKSILLHLSEWTLSLAYLVLIFIGLMAFYVMAIADHHQVCALTALPSATEPIAYALMAKDKICTN